MATILQPSLAFTEIFATTQERATASFRVRFTQAELNAAGAPKSKIRYTAQVRLEVIRVVPVPSIGTPSWLESTVTLQTTTVKVKLPTVGWITSLSTDFRYGLVPADPAVWDSLHVVITLFRSFYLAGVLLAVPVYSNTTNYLRLTLGNLANPQPNGVIIQPPS
jgi:hypothetical protein